MTRKTHGTVRRVKMWAVFDLNGDLARMKSKSEILVLCVTDTRKRAEAIALHCDKIRPVTVSWKPQPKRKAR